jgi:hypothetical protein
MSNTKDNDATKDGIDCVKHSHTFDTNSINRVIENASRDSSFITKSVQLLRGIKFPVYNEIMNYTRSITNDPEIITLFESIDGFIEYKDQYSHVTYHVSHLTLRL